MAGLFQIGIYQPDVPADPFGRLPGAVGTNPYNRDYGTNGYTLTFYDVYQPQQVVYTPPAVVGQDVGGFPSVRGFGQMVWTYNMMRPDNWYFLHYLHRLARQSSGQYAGHVKIQWPDPQSGQLQQASARWDTIESVARNMPVYESFAITFSHVGVDDLNATPIPGIWYVG